MPTPESLANQLLDLQVRHHLDRLSEDSLESSITGLVEEVLAVAGRHQIADLVEREKVIDAMTRGLVTVPSSAAVGGLIEMMVQIVVDGPSEPYAIGDLVEQDRVEEMLDSVLGLTPALEHALESLTDSPLVGTTASRFMGRIVGEVLQANQAVADKVPGLGSLMSFGTSAASRVMGAADKQFEGLIGDTVGKGGTFAVRRLNKILIETLQDPTTRAAVMQVWEMVAEAEISGRGDQVDRDEIARMVDAGHDTAISVMAGERAARLGTVVVEAFFDRFGGYSPTELLEELDLSSTDLIAYLVRISPAVVSQLRESGELERIVRAQLEPFYTSPEVKALLDASTRDEGTS